MQNFSASPKEIFGSLWRNKGLIRNLVHREVVGRYKGSMLGIVWSFVTPLFMLAVYTFVFSVVFKARWGSGGEGSSAEFALILFAGLLVFKPAASLMQSCQRRSSQRIKLALTTPALISLHSSGIPVLHGVIARAVRTGIGAIANNVHDRRPNLQRSKVGSEHLPL